MRLKTHIRFFVLTLSLFIPVAYASAQKCLSYEAAGVRLTGTIGKKTFPGPPNYESIKKGDEPETYWILHLARPICTTASAEDDAESNVTEIQLILIPKQYALYRKFIGGKARVTVTGKLSHAMTGHHHTQVLMEITGMSRAR